ncbi:grpb/dephospho-CoA kinase [Trichoderma austrokoningii]
MPLPVEAIIKTYPFDPNDAERIAFRRIKNEIRIVDPNPLWPQAYETLKARIVAALGSTIVEIAHVGSTSVPGLPAKDLIDIDLTVKDVLDEASYVPQLEAAGFDFLFREPKWHDHRFFCAYEPVCNLHIFGPDCPETVRHKIFRDWLRKTPEDRDAYAAVKREAAEAARRENETVNEYAKRKDAIVAAILQRAFRDLGYIE